MSALTLLKTETLKVMETTLKTDCSESASAATRLLRGLLRVTAVLVLSLLLVPAQGFAQALLKGNNQDALTYRFGGDFGSCEVTGIDRLFQGEVVIPDHTILNNCVVKVVAIADRSFADCAGLTKVTIPYTVERIGDYAFYNCQNLLEVHYTYPSSETKINGRPESWGWKSIGAHCYEGCGKLAHVNWWYGSSGEYAYAGCKSLRSALALNHVRAHTFDGCEKLETVSLASASEIDEYAFGNCRSLLEVSLPTNCDVRPYAFAGCLNLTTVSAGSLWYEGWKPTSDIKSYNRFPSSAFIGCSSLRSLGKDGQRNQNLYKNGSCFSKDGTQYVLCPAGQVGRIVIPNTVTSILPGAFDGCLGVDTFQVDIAKPYEAAGGVLYGQEKGGAKSVARYPTSRKGAWAIPNGIAKVRQGAFADCIGITKLSIPASVTIIEGGAFARCTSLTEFVVDASNPAYQSIDGVLYDKKGSVLVCYPSGRSSSEFVVPSGVTSIGESAFEGAHQLLGIVLPEHLQSVGNNGFRGCSRLTEVSLGGEVTRLGNGALEECLSLRAASLPSQLKAIGARLFKGCASLTAITLPSTVTRIGQEAFYGCTSLTNVTLPEKLASLGGGAFALCEKLASIDIPEGLSVIGGDTFNGCVALTSVRVPSSVATIGRDAFSWCTALHDVCIPYTVTAIGPDAFTGCLQLGVVKIVGKSSFDKQAFADNFPEDTLFVALSSCEE